MLVKYKDDVLEIYLEKRKRKLYVGDLKFNSQTKEFMFSYSDRYRKGPTSIPLGPDLPLKKSIHYKKELFPFFRDRIPDRDNSAYKEYCHSMGISPQEKNPIVLLGTIGRRGPSSFVFERVPDNDLNLDELVATFRKSLSLTISELSLFFDVTEVTLARLEQGVSKDYNLHRLVYC